MYPSSAAYKTKIALPTRVTRITGTLTLADTTVISITDADIVLGTLKVQEQCVTGDDFEIGNIYAAELRVSLITPTSDPWNLDGAVLNLFFGLSLGGGVWEDIPLGVFNILEIERNEGYSAIVAYDNLTRLDVPLGSTVTTEQTTEQLVTNACATAGVTLATTHTTFETFPNKDQLWSLPEHHQVKTCRDLVMWACQLAGTFTRCNRAGEVELIPLHSESVRTITAGERIPTTKVGDATAQTTGLGMQVLDEEYVRGTLDRLMQLPTNPFLILLDTDTVETVLDAILTEVALAVYTPFTATFNGDPTLQAGDYLTLTDTGSIAGNPTGLLTHSTWAYRGKHEIKSVGKSRVSKIDLDQNGKRITALSADVVTTRKLVVEAQSQIDILNSLPPVGDLAYLDLLEASFLGSTIISGGVIKSNLLTADNIVTGRLQSYDLANYFDLDSGEFSLAAGRVTYLSGVLAINFTGTAIETALNTKADATDLAPYQQYIRFEGGDIILGDVNSSVTLKIENDRIGFYQNDPYNPTAYFTNDQLYVRDINVTNSLKIDGFMFWYRQDNGHLSFGKAA